MQDILELIADAKLAPKPIRLEEDAELLEMVGPRREINCVMRLRHSHHLLARALAEGKSAISAAAIAGYAPSTVSSLKADPAFQELLAHYRTQVDDLFLGIQDRIGALGLSFLDELQHRLETEPESFSIGQLRALAESLLDRSIAPSKGLGRGGTVGGPTAIAVNIRFAEPAVQTLELPV